MSDPVHVERDRLIELEEAEAFLNALQAVGVDNWDGYEIAQDTMEKWGYWNDD